MICLPGTLRFAGILVFSLIPFFSAQALDPLKGIQPPTLKPTIPTFQVPAVRAKSVGIIRKQGTTSYMYGTHILVDDDGRTLYALKSDRIKLDPYVGRKVTVSGELIKGYPVEGGPTYLNVDSVE